MKRRLHFAVLVLAAPGWAQQYTADDASDERPTLERMDNQFGPAVQPTIDWATEFRKPPQAAGAGRQAQPDADVEPEATPREKVTFKEYKREEPQCGKDQVLERGRCVAKKKKDSEMKPPGMPGGGQGQEGAKDAAKDAEAPACPPPPPFKGVSFVDDLGKLEASIGSITAAKGKILSIQDAYLKVNMGRAVAAAEADLRAAHAQLTTAARELNLAGSALNKALRAMSATLKKDSSDVRTEREAVDAVGGVVDGIAPNPPEASGDLSGMVNKGMKASRVSDLEPELDRPEGFLREASGRISSARSAIAASDKNIDAHAAEIGRIDASSRIRGGGSGKSRSEEIVRAAAQALKNARTSGEEAGRAMDDARQKAETALADLRGAVKASFQAAQSVGRGADGARTSHMQVLGTDKPQYQAGSVMTPPNAAMMQAAAASAGRAKASATAGLTTTRTAVGQAESTLSKAEASKGFARDYLKYAGKALGSTKGL